MEKKDFQIATKKSKELLTVEAKEEFGAKGRTWRGKDEPITTHYSWVDEREILDAKTFEDVAKAFRWSVGQDEKGNIDAIYFDGQKLGGDELAFLDTIAPYVKKDSYIEMEGEEGERWKWYFNGAECIEYFAEIYYPELEGK